MELNRSALLAFFSFFVLLVGGGRHLCLAQIQDEEPLKLSTYSLSEAYDIEDNSPLNLSEDKFVSLLYRIDKTSYRSRSKYASYSQDLSWDEVFSNTSDYRFWVFDRPLSLKRIAPRKYPDAVDGEIQVIYQCECETSEGRPVTLISLSAPKQLPRNQTLTEPIQFSGFLYHRSSAPNTNGEQTEPDEPNQVQSDEEPDTKNSTAGPLVFIAKRFAWHPTEQSAVKLVSGHIELAKHGMDVGLFDQVARLSGKPLDREDEALYQMIAAAERRGETPVQSPMTIRQLIGKPRSFGEAVGFEAKVRRCTLIENLGEDTERQFGLRRYYNIDVFPQLDGASVTVADPNNPGEKIEVQRYPTTICCCRLPTGVSADELENTICYFEGYHYRHWRYQSTFVKQHDLKGLPVPIVVSFVPRVVSLTESELDEQTRLFDKTLFGFALFVLLGLGGMVWLYRRSDRRNKTPGAKILKELPDSIDPDKFGSEVPEEDSDLEDSDFQSGDDETK